MYALTVGFAMDFYNALILNMHISQMSILIRIIVVVVLGQLCFILTYVLLIFYREGMNELDAIAYGIEKRTKRCISTFVQLRNIVIGYGMAHGWCCWNRFVYYNDNNWFWGGSVFLNLLRM